MKKLTLVGLLFLAPLHAQFSDLATTNDGRQVYFVSPLRHTGSSEEPHAKVFVYDGNSVNLVWQAQRGSLYFGPAFFPSAITASSDGSVIAFDAKGDCLGGSSCFLAEQFAGVVIQTASGEPVSAGPHARISRNGRYILWWASASAMTAGPRAGIIDRSNGSRTRFSFSPVDGAIASNGTALVVRPDALWLIGPDGTERMVAAGIGYTRVSMDDTATTAAVESATRTLRVMDIASGRMRQPSPDERANYNATLSADGTRLLYISVIGDTPQLFFSNPDGSDWKQLTVSDDGIASAALSGDARIAWAATQRGRLVEIDTQTGAVSEVLAPPLIETVDGPLTPGSLVRIKGQRLGDKVRFDDVRGTVVTSTSTELLVQVPWEMTKPPEKRNGDYVIVTLADAASRLEATTPEFTVHFDLISPHAFTPPVHEDWSGFVDSQSAARPGELIHIYAVGLGPATCSVNTGDPAPTDRLCPATTPFTWDYWWTDTDSMPAEVLFAGFSPGLIGLYQVEARVPASPPASRLKLILERNGNWVVADFLVGGVTGPQSGGTR